MKREAMFIKTPVGLFSSPLHPLFDKAMENCETDEDLFGLVEDYAADAMNEIDKRNLTSKYKAWKDRQKK